jgi:pimeloyl-ACP methyl ester carboxylesterase
MKKPFNPRSSAVILFALVLSACNNNSGTVIPPIKEPPVVIDPALPPSSATFEASSSCMFATPLNNVQPAVNCGFVVVPQNHSKATNKTLKLPVAVFKSIMKPNSREATIMFAGGPGGSSQYLFSQIERNYYIQLMALGDVIVFDQRGAGKAQPTLECEAEQRAAAAIDTDAAYLEGDRLCAKRWRDAGYDLSSFNTRENAADVRDIAAALGYEQFNLYGISYGTLLAQRVMLDYPKLVKSVVLDGTVSPASNFIYSNGFEDSLNAVIGGCASSVACNTAYPNLVAKIDTAFDKLEKDQPVVNVVSLADKIPVLDKAGNPAKIKLDGYIFIRQIFNLLYDDSFLPYMPAFIEGVSKGKYTALANFSYSDAESDFSFPIAMYQSVVCHDYIPYGTYTGTGTDYRKQRCQIWNVGQEDRSSVNLVNSTKPTLLLSGKFDPITPPRYAQQVKTALSNSTLVSFAAGSHGAVYADKQKDNARVANCGANLMLQFFGSATLQTSCATTPIQFKVLTTDILGSLSFKDPFADYAHARDFANRPQVPPLTRGEIENALEGIRQR